MNIKEAVSILEQKDGWLKLAESIHLAQISEEHAFDIISQSVNIWKPGKSDYVSKIKSLAFPVNDKEFRIAKEGRAGVNNLLSIARGNSVWRDGKITKLIVDSRGGANKKSPDQLLRKSITLALQKSKEQGVSRKIAERLVNDCLDSVY